jgi:ABC-type nitrate/sulfonate/bicarbonate transport system substrate-binding protein
VVNIAQVFRRPAMLLLCLRTGIGPRAANVRGRKIGVWNVGDQYDVRYWLRRNNIPESEVEIVPQRPDARDLIEGKIECGTAMSYNEYWTLLRSGISPSDLHIVRFADEDSAFLEDGLYATEAALADPAKRELLARFVRVARRVAVRQGKSR